MKSHKIKTFGLFILFIVIPVQKGLADDNKLLYPGVVQIETSEGPQGTGFFISQDIIATAFHTITFDEYKGSVEENIYFLDGKSDSKYSVSEIVALDAKHDIALLKVSDYVSQFFYPPISTVSATTLLEKITIPGFTEGDLIILEGEILGPSNYDIKDSDSFFGFTHNRKQKTKGMSGAPVLSSKKDLLGVHIEGKVWGIIRPVGLNLFTSVEKLWNLLEKPALSCKNISCVKDELKVLQTQALFSRDRQAQYKLAMFSDDPIQDFWLEQSAENGHPSAQFFLGKKEFLSSACQRTYWLKKSVNQDYPPARQYVEDISNEEYNFFCEITRKLKNGKKLTEGEGEFLSSIYKEALAWFGNSN